MNLKKTFRRKKHGEIISAGQGQWLLWFCRSECGRLTFQSFQFFLLRQNVSKLSINKREETGRETWEEGGGGAIDEEGASNWTWSIRASHGCPANIQRWWIMGLLAIFSPCCRAWGLFFCCTLRQFLHFLRAWLTVIQVLFMNGGINQLDSTEIHAHLRITDFFPTA